MIKQVVDKEIYHSSKGTSAYFRDLEKDVTLTFTLLARAPSYQSLLPIDFRSVNVSKSRQEHLIKYNKTMADFLAVSTLMCISCQYSSLNVSKLISS